MSHTKGPLKHDQMGELEGIFTIRDDNKNLVGHVHCATTFYDDVMRAETYANLFVAAPALLEALKLATHELNAIRARDGAPQHIDWYRGHPIQTNGCTHEWWDELTEKCMQAIAQAESQS